MFARSGHISGRPNTRIVLVSGTAAGRLYLDRQVNTILIVDLTLLPEFHRQGIGRAVVSELQSGAAAAEKSLTGHVRALESRPSFLAAHGIPSRRGRRAVSQTLVGQPSVY